MMKKARSLVIAGAATVCSAASAFAASDPQVDAMFSAVDLTSLKVQVATLLTATLLVPLMFVGARLVKRGIKSAG